MRRKHNFSSKILFFLTVLFFALLSANVYAETGQTSEKQTVAQQDSWELGFEIYLWGASLGGQTASGSNIDVDFDDVLDNLEIGFMSVLGARKGKWTFLADVIYLDVENDETINVLGEDIRLSAELTGWVITPIVGYNLVETPKGRLDIVGGVRYLNLDMTLGLGPLGDEESSDIWDGIVGIRGNVNLSEKWYLPYHVDIGAGDSDLTWQAMAGIGYRFSKVDVIVAYRYLDYEFDGSYLLDNLNLSGPLAGVKFVF